MFCVSLARYLRGCCTIFFFETDQKIFLNIFNFGKPEIRNITFVFKLDKLFNNIGIDVKR